MSLLCVRVKKAKLSSKKNEKFNCYACLKVQNVKSSTVCVRGNEPVWEQDYMFEINRLDLYLTVELWDKGMLWDHLLGSVPVALRNVPHSDEEGDGDWLKLYSNVDVKDGVVSGSQDLTPHTILCDIRFDYPSELSDDEVLILQQKLDQLNEVQDESWMIDRPLDSLSKTFATSSISIESDYHSDASFPLPYHTTQHANSSSSQQTRALLNRELDRGLRSNSLASNTDESYNPDVGSETESRASDRIYPMEIESDTEAERYQQNKTQPVHFDKTGQPPPGPPDIRIMTSQDSPPSFSSNPIENALTPARIRWIRVFNRVRGNITGEEMDEEKLNELQSKKSSLWNIGLEGCFFANINSKPDIRPRNRSVPFVSGLSIAVMKRQPGLPSALTTTHASLNDTALKLHVYKKTLEALIYPVSCTMPHNFSVWSVTTPTYCSECEGLLWGLARQGLRCNECGIKCHEKCKDLLNDDCMQRAAEKSTKHGAPDKAQAFVRAMKEQMNQKERDNPEMFNLVREVFHIDAQQQKKLMETAKQSVIDKITSWSAKLTITVVEAKNLQAKDKTGSSDPYVTIQVGKIKKRTPTVFNSLEPEWNTTFTFECRNSSERIKVRVWDEDDDVKARFKQRLKRESDDFLGQVLIDVHKLSGEMEFNYNLQKRTDRSAVSGTITLRINAEVKGEEKVASYYIQYSCLHENIFQHVCKENNDAVAMPRIEETKLAVADEKWKVYFSGFAQEIVHEFASHFGVESIYQAMTHFSCLSWKYKCAGILPVMNVLLAQINSFYSKTTSPESKETAHDRFTASNFGTEKFVKLLDNLHNSLRIDLSMYRKHFPASEKHKFADLKTSMDLLTSISFFRRKIQDQSNLPKIPDVVKECVKACAGSTYRFVFMDQLDQVLKKEQEGKKELMKARKLEDSSDVPSPPLDKLDFWSNLITLLVTVLEEDQNVYSPVFDILKFNLAEVSASELWRLFADDMCSGMAEHAIKMLCSDNEYINLQFKVKFFWDKYVAHAEDSRGTTPQYFKWFEPFSLHWLENSEVFALNFVDGAYKRDKKDGFQRSSEHSRFSCSVVDTFTQLNQSIDIVIKLNCTDDAVLGSYMHRFAQTIKEVLARYVSYVRADFPAYCQNEPVVCILMNNIQQLRVQVQKIYNTMGGEKLDKKACEILEEVQFDLNTELDHLSGIFGESFTDRVEASVKASGALLYQIKGGVSSGAQNGKENAEADNVLRPLMDLLNESLEIFASSCEKTILKRVLKELWKLVVVSLEKIIVLPPLNGITGPQLLLSAAKDLSQLSKLKDITRDDVTKTLTPKQCAILGIALDVIKLYFHANGNGLKKSYVEKSPCLAALKHALSLYTQTTDALIKLFVSNQTKQKESDHDFGVLSTEININTHPGTGEHAVAVRVVSVSDIKWKTSSIFKPFVEVSIVGPHLGDRKRKFATKTKSGTWSPSYNESFVFNLSNEDSVSCYELQFCVKDYYFAREDRVIGVAAVPLSYYVSMKSSTSSNCLQERITFSDASWTILRILSQRNGDEIAKEFVQLKSCSRSAEEKPPS